MGAAVRAAARGTQLGDRFLHETGSGFREARIALGLSQAFVANSARISRIRYGRAESGRLTSLTILEYARIAPILGLDPALRLYSGGSPVRDSAHARRLRKITERVRPPLVARTEVALPALPDRRELRAWDLVITSDDERTAIELEMRLSDLQALERRLALKRRDDPPAHFVLGFADTRSNRQVLREFGAAFPDLARLRPSPFFRAIEAGRHPASGILLV